jgi:glycosyltransferase involved in cell wall biosynthesis
VKVAPPRDSQARLRVLLVTDWTANEGGIEAYVLRTADALRTAGHEVRLLTSSVSPGARDVAHYVATGTDSPAAQAFLQVANPFAVARLREALRQFRPDVVQVNMFEKYLSPAIFAPLRGVPTVAFVHYYKPVCPTALKVLPDGSFCRVPAGLVCWRSGCVGLAEWLRDRPRYALIRAGLRASRVLACSRWMADLLRLNGMDSTAMPLPVPPPAPGFLRSPAAEPTFLFCGRLDRAKGSDVLLHAMARVLAGRPAVRLRIMGAGPRLPELEALAVRLGIAHAVRFDGWRPFADIETALGGAWALVAPSVWPEPLGLTAIEAITRGVPAIASATGGFAETVRDGVSGHLVPNGDVEALAACLIGAVDRGPVGVPRDEMESLRRRHDPSHHAELLTTVFHEVIAASPRAS